MVNQSDVTAIDTLAAAVEQALAQSDTLELWDVSIGLDRARVALEALRKECVSQPPSEDEPRAPSSPAPDEGFALL